MTTAADRQLLKLSDSAYMAGSNETFDGSSDRRSNISLEAASQSTAMDACVTAHEAGQPTACAESQPQDVKSMKVVSQTGSAPGQPAVALPGSSLATWESTAHGLMEGRVTDLMLHARTLSISRPGQVSSCNFHMSSPIQICMQNCKVTFIQGCEQLVPLLGINALRIQPALEKHVMF